MFYSPFRFPTADGLHEFAIFPARRYFEEFEKRIPRDEMEKMEVMMRLHDLSSQKECNYFGS